MKPIIFNTEMVKAILDSRKTRFAKFIGNRFRTTEFLPFNEEEKHMGYRFSILDEKTNSKYDTASLDFFTAYGFSKYKLDDILYVREPVKVMSPPIETCRKMAFKYLADNLYADIVLDKEFDISKNWIQRCQGVPNGCIKEMARIFLKVTNVRVERLQDITFGDIEKEGYPHEVLLHHRILKHKAISAENKHEEDILNWWINNWNSTAKDGYKWKDNPYVFVYEFKRIEK